MKKIICFCGVLTALCMTTPVTVYADDVPVFPDRFALQQDEDGNAWYQNGDERITGMFAVEPDYILGDVTRDDVVDAFDASELLNASAQAGAGVGDAAQILKELFPDFEDEQTAFRYADVNNDFCLDAEDAAQILSYAAQSGTGGAVHALGYACYYADENGFLQTGWIQDGDNLYYGSENYALLSGWVSDGENQYYLDGETYTPLTGWQTVGNKVYYFEESGILRTGWLTFEGNEYYLKPEDGSMATGFVCSDGLYYYMGEDGIMQKRKWLFLGDKTYYLGVNGDCLTGWQNLTGYDYYFQPENGGLMSTGWTAVGDKTYYFDPENGTLQKGWLTIGNGVYYLDASTGAMATGWQTIGGNKYYFYENGQKAVSTTIDGIELNENGTTAAASEKLTLNKQRAKEALQKNGSSVSAIYSYMRSTNRYKYTEPTKTLSQIEANGWLYYVDYAFTHKYCVCYYMAAKMDFILREAGHECRIVHATHGSGDHYWNQVYIDGSWVNYDCTNNYNAYSWSKIIAAGDYTFLGYVTPIYQ